MRIKEEVYDYRYFLEFDFLFIIVDEEWIEEIRKRIFEFFDQKKERYIKEYGFLEYDVGVLILLKVIVSFFEECIKYM